MRFLVFITLIGTTLGFSTPAWSAWEAHVLDDLGITKDFPAEPVRTETIYRAPEIVELELEAVQNEHPAVHFETEVDNIIYRMTVVDFRELLGRSVNFALECITIYEEAGEVVSNINAITGGRLDPLGGTWTWGREVTVDLPENRGRVIGACYFTKGRLYRLEAHILPEHGDMLAIDALRFTNALEFHIDREFVE